MVLWLVLSLVPPSETEAACWRALPQFVKQWAWSSACRMGFASDEKEAPSWHFFDGTMNVVRYRLRGRALECDPHRHRFNWNWGKP